LCLKRNNYAGTVNASRGQPLTAEAVILPIEFQLNRDPHLLEQYYQLRQHCFRTELGISDFDGSEDEGDRQSRTMLALKDGHVIGGVRISPNIPLRKQLQEFNLKLDSCCIWERFAIDPAVRSVQLIRDFVAHLIEFSRLCNYQHALVLSSLRNARFYRQCHTALGVEFKIHRKQPGMARGPFADLEHYLSVSNLQECTTWKMAA
jgi:acetyltransferase (GNAT) family protein